MNYLFLDTEYSSFFSNDRPKSGELLEIGMVCVVDNVKRDTFKEFARPLTDKWNKGAEAVHKITRNQALMEQHPKDLAQKVIDFLERNDRVFTVVGHSCSGDKKYIERLMLDHNLISQWHSRIRPQWKDTNTIAKTRSLGLKGYTLTDLCRYFKIVFEAHDALEDADATRKVYELLQTMPREYKYQTQEMHGMSHVEKRKLYMDSKYIQLGSECIYISEHATQNKEAMKIIIEELWDLYVEKE